MDASVQKPGMLLHHSSFVLQTSPATAPGIVLYLDRTRAKARQGKVFLVNASQVFEKGHNENFIPPEGIAA